MSHMTHPMLQFKRRMASGCLAMAALVITTLWGADVGAAERSTDPQLGSMRSAKVVPRVRSARSVPQRQVIATRAVSEPARESFGQAYGLHRTEDALDLKSSVAFVVDQDTSEVLFSKNPQAVLPIASLTKLMTALVVVEAQLPLDEMLEVSEADIDTEKGSRSRLAVGTQLSRGEMLHLALMASENRAASSLGRHYPGGLDAFVQAMNRKAAVLGMTDTRYVEPTGLSSRNQASAPDLARLVKAAYGFPLLRELSTSPEAAVAVGRRTMQFHNTNGLVRNPSWDIGLQKTGYIVEAGRCLVLQAQMAGRQLIMVFLDSAGKYSRIGDAERVRRWIESDAARDSGSRIGATSRVRTLH
jgi:serine-type D-Ala-D-Ala endopeptidase (penicillin-binding protein 7)